MHFSFDAKMTNQIKKEEQSDDQDTEGLHYSTQIDDIIRKHI
jgi:hypothetical protein